MVYSPTSELAVTVLGILGLSDTAGVVLVGVVSALLGFAGVAYGARSNRSAAKFTAVTTQSAGEMKEATERIKQAQESLGDLVDRQKEEIAELRVQIVDFQQRETARMIQMAALQSDVATLHASIDKYRRQVGEL